MGDLWRIDYAEKRTAKRIPVVCEVIFKFLKGQRSFKGASKNLSIDGIAFGSEQPAQPGDILELALVPPAGSKIMPLNALVEVTRNCAISGQWSFEIAGKLKQIVS